MSIDTSEHQMHTYGCGGIDIRPVDDHPERCRCRSRDVSRTGVCSENTRIACISYSYGMYHLLLLGTAILFECLTDLGERPVRGMFINPLSTTLVSSSF